MLAVTPGAARAVLVVLVPACRADHGAILRLQRKPARDRDGPWLAAADRLGQAALARRIRRRRSDARSSSFRPPQVPYFSGREIA